MFTLSSFIIESIYVASDNVFFIDPYPDGSKYTFLIMSVLVMYINEYDYKY